MKKSCATAVENVFRVNRVSTKNAKEQMVAF